TLWCAGAPDSSPFLRGINEEERLCVLAGPARPVPSTQSRRFAMAENVDVKADAKWCFAWFAEAPSATGADRAALVKNTKWARGDIITVSFLDGDPGVQQRVKEAAKGWTGPGLANLTLSFRNDTNTMIRISFRYAGSWSVLGTTCKKITDKSQP